MPEKTWLHHTDSEYDRYVEEWLFADDHLTGAVLRGSDRRRMAERVGGTVLGEEPWRKTRPPLDRTVEKYLLIRVQGEPKEAYAERVALANYTPLFALSCIALTGMVRAAEKAGGEIVRTAGTDALGSLLDADTTLGKMRRDADGRGTDYDAYLSHAGCEILAKRTAYVAVDGFLLDEDGNEIGLPRLRLIPPEAVLDKNEDPRTGRLLWVKVKTMADTRDPLDPAQKETMEDRWDLYWPDRVETWREEETTDGRPKQKVAVLEKVRYWMPPTITEEGTAPTFLFYADEGRRFPVPPVFRVDLPLKVNVGFLMAQYNNKIFNKESELDFQLRVASFAKFLKDVVDEDGEILQDLDNAVNKAFEEGSTLVPDRGASRYASPPVDGIEAKGKRLDKMIDTYMKVFFQTFGAAVIEQTATEIAFDVWSRVESFLTRFADALDELENKGLFFLSQITAPDRPEEWSRASVDRSKLNFAALDVRGKLEKLIERTQPSMRLPIGPENDAWLAERYLAQAGRILTAAERAALTAYLAEEDALRRAAMAPAPETAPEVAPALNGQAATGALAEQ